MTPLHSALQRHRTALIILGAVGLVYAIGLLPMRTEPQFNSPDETATYAFAAHFAQHGSLLIPEASNTASVHIIAPRNAVAVEGGIVPAGFLGMPFWYGVVGRFTGIQWFPVVTLALSLSALWCGYWSVRQWLGQRVAHLSMLLMAFSTPFWYLTLRPMTPSIVFVDLLVISVALTIAFIRRPSVLHAVVAGGVLGIATTVRAVELLWVLPVWVAVFVVFRRQVSARHGLAFLAACIILWVPMFVVNAQLYGHWYETGYLTTSDGEGIGQLHALRRSVSLTSLARTVVAPFGWHPSLVWQNARLYLGGLQPWLLPLTALGALILSRRSFPRRTNRLFLIATTAIAVWLTTYYGSGTFFGSAAEHRSGVLGSSYLRYWLPVMFLFVPLASVALVAIMGRLRSRLLRACSSAALLLLIVSLSFLSVMTDPAYGSAQLAVDASANIACLDQLAVHVPRGSVVVAGTFDKVLFPHYRVVGYGRHQSVDALLPTITTLAQATPVYWVSASGTDLVDLQVALDRAEGVLTPVALIDSCFTVSRLRIVRESS